MAPPVANALCVIQARRSLELKVGAQVMLIRNISQKRGLVNGARGVIERWVGRTNPLPVVRFVNVSTSCTHLMISSTLSSGLFDVKV